MQPLHRTGRVLFVNTTVGKEQVNETIDKYESAGFVATDVSRIKDQYTIYFIGKISDVAREFLKKIGE